MNKRIITLITILILLSTFNLYAVDFYNSLNLEYSYDTNVFSSPLPQYDSGDWLQWRNANPFIQKHSIGFNTTFDIFFHKENRVGISSSLSCKFPIVSTSTKPIPLNQESNFSGDWDYISFDSYSDQDIALFGAFGPIFRGQFNPLDLGIAIRLSLGAYQYKEYELIIGIQAEPYINVFINHNAFISIKFTYDTHIIKLINDNVHIFEDHYQMLSIAPSIGLGFKY